MENHKKCNNSVIIFKTTIKKKKIIHEENIGQPYNKFEYLYPQAKRQLTKGKKRANDEGIKKKEDIAEYDSG